MNHKQWTELDTLARRLPEVPEEKFSMGRWAKGTLDTTNPAFECDYAGCAIGWAPKLIPDLGLTLVHDPTTGRYRPYYESLFDDLAIARYFGIDLDMTYYLFYPNRYGYSNITTGDVARRIRVFLDDNPPVEEQGK